MSRKSKLLAMTTAAVVALASVSAWAGCGTCEAGKEKKEVKKDAACAVGCKDGKACATAEKSKDGCKGGTCPAVGKTCKDTAAAKEKVATINTAGLAALVKAKTAVTILDARSGKYDDGRRLPGATQLSPSADAEAIAKVVPDKNALVVTYCAGVTCPASEMLAKRLHELGYSNVIEYPEGIAGWEESGNEVEKASK